MRIIRLYSKNSAIILCKLDYKSISKKEKENKLIIYYHCDPTVSYVEYLDKIIQVYKRIYQEMSYYFSFDLYKV
jgi:hypothetical protein